MFAVNDRARINMPGNTMYHNQVVRVVKVFPHDNSFAARVRFNGGGERTLAFDKLLPFTPPVIEAPPMPEPSYVPPLPSWAGQGREMRRGCDLQPGDTVYLSWKANPRVLSYRASETEWRGVAVNGGRRYGTSIYLSLTRWYVVKSKGAK